MSNRFFCGFLGNEVGLYPCRTFLSDLLKDHPQNSPLIRLKFLQPLTQKTSLCSEILLPSLPAEAVCKFVLVILLFLSPHCLFLYFLGQRHLHSEGFCREPTVFHFSFSFHEEKIAVHTQNRFLIDYDYFYFILVLLRQHRGMLSVPTAALLGQCYESREAPGKSIQQQRHQLRLTSIYPSVFLTQEANSYPIKSCIKRSL